MGGTRRMKKDERMKYASKYFISPKLLEVKKKMKL